MRCGPHLLEMGVEVEVGKADGGMRAETLTPVARLGYYNKLLYMLRMTKRG